MKTLLIIGLIGLLAGGGFVYWIFNKPHRDVTQEKAVQLTDQKLFDAFKANEAAANQRYLDKAIEL